MAMRKLEISEENELLLKSEDDMERMKAVSANGDVGAELKQRVVAPTTPTFGLEAALEATFSSVAFLDTHLAFLDSRYYLVLSDIDGTLNAFHPEQNPGPKDGTSYYAKDENFRPLEKPEFLMSAFKVAPSPKWPYYSGAINECDAESLQRMNLLIIEHVLRPLAKLEKFEFSLAIAKSTLPPGWSLDQYRQNQEHTERMQRKEFGVPINMFAADTSFTFSDSLEPIDVSGRELQDLLRSPGYNDPYVRKANNLRLRAGCKYYIYPKVEKVWHHYGTPTPEAMLLRKYDFDWAVAIVVDASNGERVVGSALTALTTTGHEDLFGDLGGILVIDDCPFTMSALRVHLDQMLPRLSTIFVSPHFSIVHDQAALFALTGEHGFNENIPRQEGWYNQYSDDKPAMGEDLGEEDLPLLSSDTTLFTQAGLASVQAELHAESLVEDKDARNEQADPKALKKHLAKHAKMTAANAHAVVEVGKVLTSRPSLAQAVFVVNDPAS